MTTIRITTEQALAFRAKRNGLAGEQHGDLAACASCLLGAQAQVETHSYNALSLRTANRPPDSKVQSAHTQDTDLVRTWGQRDTLHLYAKSDWPLIHAASQEWVRSGRRGGMPPLGLVREAEQFFAAEARPLTRSDLFPLIPQSYIEELRDHPGATGKDGARRFAATRLIWTLANGGWLIFGDKIGRELSYLHRSLVWTGEWPEYTSAQANREVVRRYFGTFGPATVQDLAHYLGARVGDARPWVESLKNELATCVHPERGETLLLKTDAQAMATPLEEWPIRLLPAYDTMLMAHKDKRWILPLIEHEPLVWKRAAVVAATVLVRGQIAGSWTYKKSKGKVDLTVERFPGATFSEKELGPEISGFAEHLGTEVGRVQFTDFG